VSFLTTDVLDSTASVGEAMFDHTTDPLARAQSIVASLLAKGWTHQKIADEMGARVSARTIYRWAKGEHAPQNQNDLVALQRVAERANGE
jgi:hypothetical protein